MIDIAKRRAQSALWLADMRAEAFKVDAAGASVIRVLAGLFNDALDELEALRKPVAPCQFDVVAARKELARIDAAWENAEGPRSAENAYRDARVMLNKALAAIDAGWSAVDIEGAALAGWCSLYGRTEERFRTLSDDFRADIIREARAVLAHVGREVSPDRRMPCRKCGGFGHDFADCNVRKAEPFVITDAVVEEAAILVFIAPVGGEDGAVTSRDEWDILDDAARTYYRNEARAVLEYAASIGGVAPASRPFRMAPEYSGNEVLEKCAALGLTEALTIRNLAACIPVAAVDPRAERLDMHRRTLLQGYVANRPNLLREWHMYDEREHPNFDTWVASEIESMAHAMLAAERAPAPPRAKDIAAIYAGIREALRLLTECGVDRDADAAGILCNLLPTEEEPTRG